ncbi:MAG: ATP-binding cassette domain-containing protein [Proteobacteria bacterium]|nr:ATP-binding cassette domain-containing protein [Pseudomonadota bacterium]MBU4295979.1 ATP-binding cassette domain-containing protein [Pseudomonadota bacterium]MCG2747989.1 ATP-binding cassette domain-containing protein [Desulfobulbaceae bacterium]
MLEANRLSFRYGRQQQWLFQNLDLRIAPGEIVGLPGPSGRGKSTLAKILAGYLTAVHGSVLVDGRPLPKSGYCPVQLLFQHPELAVNPRWKAGDILAEAGQPDAALLQDLGIEPAWLTRYPHELSGGELQRICLVRALTAHTRYLLCDEMTSMLDPLSQAHIWQKVLHIAEKRKLGLLVISHDKALLDKLCHRTHHYFATIADFPLLTIRFP